MITGIDYRHYCRELQGHSRPREARLSTHHPLVRCEQCQKEHDRACIALRPGSLRTAQSRC